VESSFALPLPTLLSSIYNPSPIRLTTLFFTPCIPFTPYVLVVHSFLHYRSTSATNPHPHSLFPPFRTLRPLRTASANSTSEALFAATHRRTPSFEKYCQSVHYRSITHFEIISQSPEVACMILIIWHTTSAKSSNNKSNAHLHRRFTSQYKSEITQKFNKYLVSNNRRYVPSQLNTDIYHGTCQGIHQA